METQLKDIIDKIHDEGVKGAEERARSIVEAAEKQAREKVQQARSEADGIVAQAEKEAAKHQAAGEAALQQASRDLLLSVRTELTKLFEAVEKQAVADVLTPDAMTDVILALVKEWGSSGSDSLEVLVNEKDRDALEKTLQTKLSGAIKEGTTVRPVRGISAGFRIGGKGSAAYYDVTDETLAELLSAYLNPRLAEVMKSAGQQ